MQQAKDAKAVIAWFIARRVGLSAQIAALDAQLAACEILEARFSREGYGTILDPAEELIGPSRPSGYLVNDSR